MTDPDLAVVTAVKAGDTDAFRGLVDRHKWRVYSTLMSLVGDEDVAEELAQDTFVKAYTGLADFRANAAFGTWLLQIAIHNARDHRRRMARLRDRQVVSLEALREARLSGFDPADTTRDGNASNRVESREETVLVRNAMAKLPPQYREVITLKHFEGWSFEDIAASTGDSVGTLKVRAHRARRMLKDLLAEMGWDSVPQDLSADNPTGRVVNGKDTNDG